MALRVVQLVLFLLHPGALVGQLHEKKVVRWKPPLQFKRKHAQLVAVVAATTLYGAVVAKHLK